MLGSGSSSTTTLGSSTRTDWRRAGVCSSLWCEMTAASSRSSSSNASSLSLRVGWEAMLNHRYSLAPSATPEKRPAAGPEASWQLQIEVGQGDTQQDSAIVLIRR